jgi:hypothetical protein
MSEHITNFLCSSDDTPDINHDCQISMNNIHEHLVESVQDTAIIVGPKNKQASFEFDGNTNIIKVTFI